MKDISRLSNFWIQLKRSFYISMNYFRIYYNKPPVLIQGVLFPVMLFFAFTVGRIIKPIYMVSGLMTMVLFLTSTSIGPVIFPWETMRKTLERLMTCPISIKTILLGSVWSSFIYGFMFSFVPLLLGFFFLSVPLTLGIFLVLIGMFTGALSFSSFSLILSTPPTDTPGNTMILTVLIKFPLIFISPLFVPISSSPLTFVSPLSYFIDIINVGLGEASAFGAFGLLIDFTVLIAFGLGFLFLSFFIHQKTLQKRF